MLEDIGDPFYSALSRAVEDVAHRHGSLLFTGSSDEDPLRERELTLAFCARRVDGLIIVPASEDHTYLLPEMAAGAASVFVDRRPGRSMRTWCRRTTRAASSTMTLGCTARWAPR